VVDRKFGATRRKTPTEVTNMRKDCGSLVYQRPDGSWVMKPSKADRPLSVHKTLAEAERFARELLKQHGGGVLITAAPWKQEADIRLVL
jgi:hypothetical protein